MVIPPQTQRETFVYKQLFVQPLVENVACSGNTRASVNTRNIIGPTAHFPDLCEHKISC